MDKVLGSIEGWVETSKTKTTAVVFNDTSGISEAGFSGDEAPRSTIRHSSPVFESGIVQDWDGLESLWRHMFNELKAVPEEHPILCTERALNPKANREKMVHIMFEALCVPSFYLAIQPTLSLYSSGRITGVSLDLSEDVGFSVPHYEGYALPHSILELDYGSRHLSEYLVLILKESGTLPSHSQPSIARDIIQRKLCFVSLNFQEQLQREPPKKEEFQLPDGQTISLGNELFRCPEALFKPSGILGGETTMGIQRLVYDSVMKNDVSLRKDMYRNIILSGGLTLFPGIKERLEKEVSEFAPSSMKVKVETNAEHDVWRGGSLLASLSPFQSQWITQKEYDELGPAIVHRKCF
eukprot:Lithocolla_globosa_v1_NODE_2862_length_1843_cov_2.596756.p1 type:complete len:353 gc:universal NODE_2862_length_1843_cov_2.596756:690-1748(+)